MPNHLFKKRNKIKQSIFFDNNLKSINKPVIKQLLIILLMLTSSIILIIYIQKNNFIILLGNHINDFLVNIKNSFISLYYSFLNLFFIIFTILLIILIIFLVLSSLARFYKVIRYLVRKNNKYLFKS